MEGEMERKETEPQDSLWSKNESVGWPPRTVQDNPLRKKMTQARKQERICSGNLLEL